MYPVMCVSFITKTAINAQILSQGKFSLPTLLFQGKLAFLLDSHGSKPWRLNIFARFLSSVFFLAIGGYAQFGVTDYYIVRRLRAHCHMSQFWKSVEHVYVAGTNNQEMLLPGWLTVKPPGMRKFRSLPQSSKSSFELGHNSSGKVLSIPARVEMMKNVRKYLDAVKEFLCADVPGLKGISFCGLIEREDINRDDLPVLYQLLNSMFRERIGELNSGLMMTGDDFRWRFINLASAYNEHETVWPRWDRVHRNRENYQHIQHIIEDSGCHELVYASNSLKRKRD